MTVAAGNYTDAAGNAGVGGADTVAIDTANPTVTVDIVDAALNDGDNSSLVTFTFSEAPVGFTHADVTRSAARSSAVTADRPTRWSTRRPSRPTDGFRGTGSVTVTAGSYTDAAGNAGGGAAPTRSRSTRATRR